MSFFTNREALRNYLESRVAAYNTYDFIEEDPISVPHHFVRKEDIEISGFFAAMFAWGSRKVIIRKSRELMDRMDGAPHDFITGFSKKDSKSFHRFVHRTFNAEDCVFFAGALKKIYTHHNGLESLFTKGFLRTDAPAANAIEMVRKQLYGKAEGIHAARHFSSPAKNSACKRTNMFLRWMCRKDAAGVDFGIWKNISPALLQIPLDVHTARTARHLGLISRKQNDWNTVTALTRVLRELDPADPVKYDFALFGAGVYELV